MRCCSLQFITLSSILWLGTQPSSDWLSGRFAPALGVSLVNFSLCVKCPRSAWRCWQSGDFPAVFTETADCWPPSPWWFHRGNASVAAGRAYLPEVIPLGGGALLLDGRLRLLHSLTPAKLRIFCRRGYSPTLGRAHASLMLAFRPCHRRAGPSKRTAANCMAGCPRQWSQPAAGSALLHAVAVVNGRCLRHSGVWCIDRFWR